MLVMQHDGSYIRIRRKTNTANRQWQGAKCCLFVPLTMKFLRSFGDVIMVNMTGIGSELPAACIYMLGFETS